MTADESQLPSMLDEPARTARRVLIPALALAVLACRSKQPTPTKAEPESAGETTPSAEPEAQPEAHLIRYACLGFNAAVAEGAPRDRLLSHSARRAIELGGPPVEAASKRWALLSPPALLELIDRYELEAQPDLERCAGLRAHLEAMSRRVGLH